MRHQLIDIASHDGRAGADARNLIAGERPAQQLDQLRLAHAVAAQQDDAVLLEHVEPLGGRVLGPPNDMPWGQRVAHILDPDGNTVNLTEPI